MQVSLLEHSGVRKEVAKRAVNWSKSIAKRRSSKAKNRRAPPKRKKHQGVSDSGGEENAMAVDDVMGSVGEDSPSNHSMGSKDSLSDSQDGSADDKNDSGSEGSEEY